MDGKGQIVVERVTHTYRPPRGRTVLALSDISLEVRPREFLALLGPSGCGKSTLLYLVGGFLPTEAGRIVVEGKPVTAPGPDRGIVFQHFALFPWKTVRTNILYGLERQGLPRPEREKRAQAFIDLVGLNGFEESYPSQLSGGMKQRTAIARTLAFDPSILLMDEPFGALDAQTRSLMQTELLNIWKRTPKTVIFVTHDVQEAVYLAERVAVMSARPGRIKKIVETKFGNRDPSILRSKEFVEKVDEFWNLVRDEAIKAQETKASNEGHLMQGMTLAGFRYLPLVLLALGWEAVARLNIIDSQALPPLSSRRGRVGRSRPRRRTRRERRGLALSRVDGTSLGRRRRRRLGNIDGALAAFGRLRQSAGGAVLSAAEIGAHPGNRAVARLRRRLKNSSHLSRLHDPGHHRRL